VRPQRSSMGVGDSGTEYIYIYIYIYGLLYEERDNVIFKHEGHGLIACFFWIVRASCQKKIDQIKYLELM